MSNMIERDAEKLLYAVGIGAIALWLLPKIFTNVVSGVSQSLINLANGVGENIGDAVYDAIHPPVDETLPHTPQEAQIAIANDPESFPLSEVVKAVNNLEIAGIPITDDRISRVAVFVLNNENFFTKEQVADATHALTGY